MRIRKKIEELRMKKEAEQLLKEIEKYPELKDLQPPADLKERVYAEIERREKKLKESLTEEQQELIRMGIRYKNQQKSRKFIAVAVMVVLLLSIGMTSLGGAEKVFYRISSMFMNRGRQVVDSDDVEVIDSYSEEEVYAMTEEMFGVNATRLGYKPKGTTFKEATIIRDMPGTQIIYENEGKNTIIYWIKPNYLKSSLVKDYEDKIINETEILRNNIRINVKEYFVEKEGKRWLITFEYNEIFYSVYIMNVLEKEVEVMIEKLFFY